MLNVRSLAAELASDPSLLLNNAELNRIPWHKGANEHEFVVCQDDIMEERVCIGVGISTEVTIMEV